MGQHVVDGAQHVGEGRTGKRHGLDTCGVEGPVWPDQEQARPIEIVWFHARTVSRSRP